MGARKIPVFQVVGYKNSGKTTVTSALVQFLSDKGYNVATLKHHGHGGNPDHVAGTDSSRHQQAGAVISGVEGESELQLTVSSEAPLTWDQIMAIYQIIPHELLILEGYKNAAFPKVVLLRDENDLTLLNRLDHVCAVGVYNRNIITGDTFTFLLDDLDEVISELTELLFEYCK